jgi:hypothetical protein
MAIKLTGIPAIDDAKQAERAADRRSMAAKRAIMNAGTEPTGDQIAELEAARQAYNEAARALRKAERENRGATPTAAPAGVADRTRGTDPTPAAPAVVLMHAVLTALAVLSLGDVLRAVARALLDGTANATRAAAGAAILRASDLADVRAADDAAAAKVRAARTERYAAATMRREARAALHAGVTEVHEWLAHGGAKCPGGGNCGGVVDPARSRAFRQVTDLRSVTPEPLPPNDDPNTL